MHKTEYEETVKKPMEELVEALAAGFPGFASRSSGISPSQPFPHSQGHAILRKMRPLRLNYSRGFSFIVEYRVIENDNPALL